MSTHKGIFKNSDLEIVSSKLKFLGMLKPGQKIGVQAKSIQDNTYWNSLVRTVTGESRDRGYKFISDVMQDALNILESLSDSKNEYDIKICKNLIVDLINLNIGLYNLQNTYDVDKMYVSKIKTLSQNLDVKVHELCSKKNISYDTLAELAAEERLAAEAAEEAEASTGATSTSSTSTPTTTTTTTTTSTTSSTSTTSTTSSTKDSIEKQLDESSEEELEEESDYEDNGSSDDDVQKKRTDCDEDSHGEQLSNEETTSQYVATPVKKDVVLMTTNPNKYSNLNSPPSFLSVASSTPSLPSSPSPPPIPESLPFSSFASSVAKSKRKRRKNAYQYDSYIMSSPDDITICNKSDLEKGIMH